MSDKKPSVTLDRVVVRFAGDSGDGMQLTGSEFTFTAALAGNDLATFPDYPAEIRAPRGTVEGVSGFQVQLGQVDIHTPGDLADVLIAMNPAALRKDLERVREGGNVIIDSDAFSQRSLEKAGFESNPLESTVMAAYKVIEAPITSLNREALKEFSLDNKSIQRSRNMFALGLVYWLFDRPLETTEQRLDEKFGKKAPELAEANKAALRAGFHYGETIEALPSRYKVPAAKQTSGRYRHISGNQATAWGLMAARERLGRNLIYCSYPITPASDILHELAKYKHLDTYTIQAEDEIAAVCAAIGACYAGAVGVTASAGPGIALKGEAIGLAVMAELPLVVVDVQRGGPSTGLPTKTEQSDLNIAIYGRNGDSPAIVIAPGSPSECFEYAYLAVKLAIEHMTPVMLLTDGYLANGSEPWKFPQMADMPDIQPPVFTQNGKGEYAPYLRNEATLARYWVAAGTPGMEHRIGGLEKEELSGNVSYNPRNHEKMTRIRAEKVERVAGVLPPQETVGPDRGKLLVVGWGGTYGALYSAVTELQREGESVSLCHIRHLNPLPGNLPDIFEGFERILVCELNTGQLYKYLRAEHPQFPYESYTKIQGQPFLVTDLKNRFKEAIAAEV